MIEVKNLVKRYGGHLAVDHLNFTIEDGQIYGFLGPNGAGKSTTMNIMAGYLGATEGQVCINGHDILEEPEEAKRCIGYLPELPPLYVDMTVEEYLWFAAELKNLPGKERGNLVEQAMEKTQLTQVKGRLIRNLSKGYKQRVGLAQAMLGMPSVIILDEPTVGLDPKQIIEIRDLIRELGKEHTVILSSHILSEVSAVCDHIMIISGGKLVASDTPENLERRMTGGRRLELLVKGEPESVKATAAALLDEAAISISEKEEDGEVRTFLTAEMEQDVREELFYAFAREKLPILSMTVTKASLEEVFLELTQKQEEKETEKKEPEKKLRGLFGRRSRRNAEDGFGPVVSEAEAETGGVASEELLHPEDPLVQGMGDEEGKEDEGE
ncbi:MAG TPA: ATP-binding cassette domain-containing protein [Candidatus Cottocaccamicrobium excrementipullorum]|nr:ATP-binding cassette domain-containing protein [Candidatus Cottocaccamicrobium excrementipullorum]